MRTLSLALRFAWAGRLKVLLLTLLVAVAMTVVVGVSELSRVSTSGLEGAIAEDVGLTGTYLVTLESDFGLMQADLAQRVGGALENWASRPIELVTAYPAVQAECPPFEELGPQPLMVLTDTDLRPMPLDFGRDLPVDTEICFGGQVIPSSSIYVPSRAEQLRWTSGLLIDQDYERVASLSANSPVRYTFSLVTGFAEDQQRAISNDVADALGEDAARFGVGASDLVTVSRVDQGASIRQASEGIQIVYSLIIWGVLILGGLGLLIVELIVVRERMWFFGLARTLGATTRHVAGLVLADVALIVLLGTGLAFVLASALQPVAADLASQAFGVDVQLISPAVLPQVLAGCLLILVVAGGIPAAKASRKDPLDVLEPSG
jgi:hypothetical protein